MQTLPITVLGLAISTPTARGSLLPAMVMDGGHSAWDWDGLPLIAADGDLIRRLAGPFSAQRRGAGCRITTGVGSMIRASVGLGCRADSATAVLALGEAQRELGCAPAMVGSV